MSDIKKDTWDQFLLQHKDQATVFHTQEWMQTLEDAFGWKPKYLAAQTEDDSFLAAMPFMVDKRFGIENFLSMPFDTYGGPIGDPTTFQALTRDFAELPGIGMKYYVDFGRHVQRGGGYDRILTSTELLDLSRKGDDICGGVHRNNWKHIKAAWKAKVTCHVASTGDDLKSVWRLLQPSKDIHGNIPKELTDSIFSILIPSKRCVPYLTEVDGIPVCASLFFFYGDMAMYWAMALNKEGRVFHAHYQLVWQAIQDFKLARYKTLNLGATPQTTDTVLPWKKSWGTKTYRYVKYQKIPVMLQPILKVKQAIYG
jgi:hypothetical protein